MPRYALLVAPSANRVYSDAAPRLARAELGVFGSTVLGDRISEVTELTLGGVPYLGFEAEELSGRDVAYLSNLSAIFALFERQGEELLRPVALKGLDRYDDDLITIQKYAGKTNEQFTKLLLNVTVLAAGLDLLDDKPVVFDPLAGRGTTLNQAVMYGYDALGVDLDGKDFEAYAAFLKTWLKRKRLKHSAEIVPVRRERKLVARRLEVTMAASKEAHQAKDVQHLTLHNIDTVRAREVIKPNSADLIVTDAPYGVVHGSQQNKALHRGPIELLKEALPGWVEILRSGGALGLAFNTFTAGREQLTELLEKHGLTVLDAPELLGFEHWVDQAITRDILVARK